MYVCQRSHQSQSEHVKPGRKFNSLLHVEIKGVLDIMVPLKSTGLIRFASTPYSSILSFGSYYHSCVLKGIKVAIIIH